MKIPTALDFARLLDGVTEVSVIAPKDAAKKLREIADQLDGEGRPKLALIEAHSVQSAELDQFGNTTLILRFRYFRDPDTGLPVLDDDAELAAQIEHVIKNFFDMSFDEMMHIPGVKERVSSMTPEQLAKKREEHRRLMKEFWIERIKQ